MAPTVNNTTLDYEIKETFVEDIEDVYVENYSVFIKMGFLVFGVTSVVISLFALISMQRTKRVPYVAKYLSRGLLTFDMMFIVTSTARKFVLDPSLNVILTFTGNAWLQLAYTTVAIMALERLIVFNWPNYYLQNCTHRKIRIVTCSIWCSVFFGFMITRLLVCYLKFDSYLIFIRAGLCNQIVTIFYILLVVVVQTTSFLCYLKIFRIVQMKSTSGAHKRKLSFISVANMVKSYKSTSLVIVYLFVITSTSVSYMVILFTIRHLNLGITELRLSLDTVSVMNCILDPFLYAFWFRESRMQLMKCFIWLCPAWKSKTNQMRIEIFGIMTKEMAMSTTDVSFVSTSDCKLAHI